MGRRLQTLPPTPRRYPWARWTDGSVWEIKHGTDFKISARIMRIQILTYAREHQLKVETRITGDTIRFQFSPLP